MNRKASSPAIDNRSRMARHPSFRQRSAIFTLCALLVSLAYACGGSSSGGSPTPHSSDSFKPTSGIMTSTRIGAALALLSKARVLIVGGFDNDLQALATADLYSSRKKSFAAADPPPNAARYLGTSTRLSNGKVLIAGGVDQNGNPLDTAEVYDPAAGDFLTTTNNMSDSRAGATAALLPNGKVLIAGGLNANATYLASADLYDPATNSFTASAGAMNETRQYATATLLSSGHVLIAGGFGDTCGLTSCQDADLYDPVSDSFTASAGQMSEPRSGATATLLTSGKVLIAGGQPSTDIPTNSADLYDPLTDSFIASKGTLSVARAWATAASLHNGKVLIAGGLESGDPNGATASADLYDPKTDTFTPSKGQMSDARAYAIATELSNGTVLIAGGLNSSGQIVSTADIYTP